MKLPNFEEFVNEQYTVDNLTTLVSKMKSEGKDAKTIMTYFDLLNVCPIKVGQALSVVNTLSESLNERKKIKPYKKVKAGDTAMENPDAGGEWNTKIGKILWVGDLKSLKKSKWSRLIKDWTDNDVEEDELNDYDLVVVDLDGQFGGPRLFNYDNDPSGTVVFESLNEADDNDEDEDLKDLVDDVSKEVDKEQEKTDKEEDNIDAPDEDEDEDEKDEEGEDKNKKKKSALKDAIDDIDKMDKIKDIVKDDKIEESQKVDKFELGSLIKKSMFGDKIKNLKDLKDGQYYIIVDDRDNKWGSNFKYTKRSENNHQFTSMIPFDSWNHYYTNNELKKMISLGKIYVQI